MSRLSNDEVDAIAQSVLQSMAGGGGVSLSPTATRAVSRGGALPTGVFRSLDECVAAAAKAQKLFAPLGMVRRKAIIQAMRDSMLEHGDELARMAWEETGLGRVESKILKNKLVTTKTPGPEELESIAWTGDDGLTLVERAPFGVIGAITPTTNPTSTIICNSIGMLSAGNAVVFNVHPNATNVSLYNIGLLNDAIVAAGGPPNLICSVDRPTIETAQALMTHKGVRLLVVTGGPGVVKAAMNSGKRAICAGPGNPPVVVDETCDIDKAGADIVTGASLDNNVICTDEKEVFVVEQRREALLKAMERNGSYILTQPQVRALDKVIFKQMRGPRKPGVIDKQWVGKDATKILEQIGVHADPSVKLVVMPVTVDHPLIWTEQLMPVLPVAPVKNVDEGIDTALAAEHGFGHSAAMHSLNIANLDRMARVMNVSIFVKNGPICAGLGAGGEGYTSFSIASPTGEGLTGPLSFSRVRRCTVVGHFRIV